MPIAEDQILHVARLAKLNLSPSEPARFSRELTKIIEHFDRLALIDTDKIDIRPQCLSESVLREDIARPSLTVDEALKNAPEKKDNYFIVPRVI